MAQEILFLFPGQGSHFVGMGQDLLNVRDPFFMELLTAASDFLSTDLTRFITDREVDGFVNATNLQPLITSISLSYWNRLIQRGVVPTTVMGHSLGEITALAPAGVLSAIDTVVVSAFRGTLMDYSAEQCGGGGMAVVLFSSEDEVQDAIEEFGLTDSLFVANYNADKQTVISGLSSALAEFETKFCENRRAKIQKIDVAGPWHTPFIEPGREMFLSWSEKKEFSKPTKRFILNGTSDFADENEDLYSRVADQLVKPVYWRQSLQRAVTSLGDDCIAVEVGPGKILTGLLRANKVHKKLAMYESVNTLESIELLCDKLTDQNIV